VFDGLSDLSDVVTRLVSFFTGIIQAWLQSIIKFVGPNPIGELINSLIQ